MGYVGFLLEIGLSQSSHLLVLYCADLAAAIFNVTLPLIVASDPQSYADVKTFTNVAILNSLIAFTWDTPI